MVTLIMILSETMVDTLHAIRRIESTEISKILDVPVAELGNCLIRVYCKTSNVLTRELITDFMQQAGVVWTRKLLTRDTAPVISTISKVDQHFATLSDYVGLLAANDDALFHGVAS